MAFGNENYINVLIDGATDEQLCEQIRTLLRTIRPDWEAIKFKPFTNGITNKVVRVENVDGERLVVRIFGIGTEKIIDRANEMNNFKLLSSYGFAPAVVGSFVNGFVCGYLPGEPITVDQVRNNRIVPKIARKLAELHQIPAPAEVATPFFERKFDAVAASLTRFPNDALEQKFRHLFGDVDLRAHFRELCRLVAQAKHRELALCHNDLLIYNVLHDADADQVHFIDYEYMDTNYVLFDIANHFNEYAGVDGVNYDLLPTEEEKYNFVKHYLEARGLSADGPDVESMLADIPVFEAASHLFWAVWALMQAQQSQIDFDYLAYASLRFEQCLKITQHIKSN